MVIIAKSLDYFDTDGFPDRTATEIGGMLDRAKERNLLIRPLPVPD